MVKKTYGVTGKPITVRNPQANAIVERVHQTIGNIIRTFELEDNSPVLTSLFISGGSAQVGSFDIKNTKFEDFNYLKRSFSLLCCGLPIKPPSRQ